MSVIFEETAAERQAISAIRDELRRRIASEELSVAEVADTLALVPEGVETLLRRQWSFEEAYRVAAALGFDFAGALQVQGD